MKSMIKIKALVFAIALQTFLCNLWAWDKDVHPIVADIAEVHLSAKTRNQIEKIYDKKIKLSEIANWAEGLKTKAPRSKGWHFVNIPVQEASVDLTDYQDEPNLYSALKSQIKILGFINATHEQKREALNWIVHLMGDLHQPIYVSNNNDPAGKNPPLIFKKKKTDLHSLWDKNLIHHYFENKVKMEKALMAEIHSVRGLVHYGRGTVDDWVLETHNLAWDVYAVKEGKVTLSKNKHLSEAYNYKSYLTIKNQLKIAGLRLAAVLNRVLEAEPHYQTFAYLYDIQKGVYHTPQCNQKGQIKIRYTWYSDVEPYDKEKHGYCIKARTTSSPKPIKKKALKKDTQAPDRMTYNTYKGKPPTPNELASIIKIQKGYDAEFNKKLNDELSRLAAIKKAKEDSIAAIKAEKARQDSLAAARKARKDSIAIAEAAKKDSLAIVEKARKDSLAKVEIARKDSLAKVEKARKDSLAKVKLARKDSIAKAKKIRLKKAREDSIAAAEQARQDSLALAKKRKLEREQAKRDSIVSAKKARRDSIAQAKKAKRDSIAAAKKAKRDSLTQAKKAKRDSIAKAKQEAAEAKARAEAEKSEIEKRKQLAIQERKRKEREQFVRDSIAYFEELRRDSIAEANRQQNESEQVNDTGDESVDEETLDQAEEQTEEQVEEEGGEEDEDQSEREAAEQKALEAKRAAEQKKREEREAAEYRAIEEKAAADRAREEKARAKKEAAEYKAIEEAAAAERALEEKARAKKALEERKSKRKSEEAELRAKEEKDRIAKQKAYQERMIRIKKKKALEAKALQDNDDKSDDTIEDNVEDSPSDTEEEVQEEDLLNEDTGNSQENVEEPQEQSDEDLDAEIERRLLGL